MKKLFLTGLFVLMLGAPAAFAETQYLVSLPDIPLMPEMKELKDSGVLFDKAEGRIIEETVKAPNLTREKVLKFYNETLPALGWMPVSPGPNSSRFSRNGEQLIVNLEKLANDGLVGFAVSPIQP